MIQKTTNLDNQNKREIESNEKKQNANKIIKNGKHKNQRQSRTT